MPKINPDIAVFAETNFRNERRSFGIKKDDRRRHMYFIGKTGMGKSVVLENLIHHDIHSGNGLAVIDPHGDLVEKVIEFIPPERINDVVYFNPSDIDFPIAFNVLEKVDPKYRHLVASGLVGVFKKIWADSWGPRLEYLLRNAILALLDYPDSTLLGVNRILVDKEYRKKVVAKIQDPVVKAFWLDEFTKYNQQFLTEAIAPIQNKVGQFLSTSLIRNIVGQVKSTLSMREIMDGKKILLLNLSKGRIGEDAAGLLGAMIITKIQLAAMSRVDIAEKTRQDFYLYVDEFQNFATESFAGILSEARKYRLNLIIAHQYIEQMKDEVKAAVFGNVGTIVSFRIGATDAEELEKEYAPVFTEEDLVNLPKYNVYLKLMIDGVASNPFSATTLPPQDSTPEHVDKIVQITRERYASSREVVDDKIARWSGVETEAMLIREEEKLKEAGQEKTASNLHKSIDFLDGLRRKVMTPEEVETAEKELEKVEEVKKPETKVEERPAAAASATETIAKCDWCDVRTRINFKPDPNKPVLCKECLKDYRRMQAKGIEPPKKLKSSADKAASPASRPRYSAPRQTSPRPAGSSSSAPRPAAPSRPRKSMPVPAEELTIEQALKKRPTSFSNNRRRTAPVKRDAKPVPAKPARPLATQKKEEVNVKAGEEIEL